MSSTQISGIDPIAEKDPTALQQRVLFLIDEIGGLDGGGTERQVVQLVRLSQRLGYAPRIAVLRGSECLSEDQAGCPVYSAGAHSLFRPAGWRACIRLTRWMRSERISLVQTFFVECNIVGPWLARLAGVTVVIGSRRNLNQWQGRTSWMGPVVRRVQWLANLSTDCVVANSQVVAQAMRETERVPHHKLRVAYNGIDLARFSRLDLERRRTRKMLGIADDEILVGNISCMREVKGIPQFVAAARIVLETDPKLRFLVVGDGIDRDQVADSIHKYGLADNIYLAGAQTNVLPYLAAMDIGVLSSLAEGFSNSLLEYMASGLPVVATDVGGNREALEETGILVPPDDPAALAQAILRLRSSELRQQLGLAARRRVECFSLERAESRMEEIYSELLDLKRNSLLKN